MDITKQGAQGVRMKIQNAELYLKGATVKLIYGLQPLAERLLELASKLERLDCFHWFCSDFRESIRASFKLITRRVSDDT